MQLGKDYLIADDMIIYAENGRNTAKPLELVVITCKIYNLNACSSKRSQMSEYDKSNT